MWLCLSIDQTTPVPVKLIEKVVSKGGGKDGDIILVLDPFYEDGIACNKQWIGWIKSTSTEIVNQVLHAETVTMMGCFEDSFSILAEVKFWQMKIELQGIKQNEIGSIE